MKPVYYLIIAALSLSGIHCSEDPASSNLGQGTFKVSITDAPGHFDQVLVTFTEISVRQNNEWKIIGNQPKTVDLLSVTNGNTAVLVESELETGEYNQFRIKISEAKIVIGALTISATVSSEAQAGLAINYAFTVKVDSSVELVIDFDASRSVQATGIASFSLNPVIRVVPEKESGGIRGRILNDENVPVAYAIAGDDTIASTYVQNTNGDFLLSYLEEGTYTVAIEDSTRAKFTANGVVVQSGEITNIGQVVLQQP